MSNFRTIQISRVILGIIVVSGFMPSFALGQELDLDSASANSLIVPPNPPSPIKKQADKAGNSAEQLPSPSKSDTQSANQSDLKREIETARKNADEAKQTFEDAKRLSDIGSVSQTDLRRANFNYKLAMLDVIVLENPDKKSEVTFARAQIQVELTTKELAVIAPLFRRGAASELEYQRAVSANKVAKFALKAVEDGELEIFYRIQMAQNNLALAQEVQLKADRLIRSNAISKTVYGKIKASLKEAEEELTHAERDLGLVASPSAESKEEEESKEEKEKGESN